jgi:hypothetical protein
MSKPIKAVEYLERCGLNLKGKPAEQVATALQIAFEEGQGIKPNTFDPVTYKRFLDLMKVRFLNGGIIRTGEAWEIAKGVTGYGNICNMMRYRMAEMEGENKARKLRNGVWIIY